MIVKRISTRDQRTDKSKMIIERRARIDREGRRVRR